MRKKHSFTFGMIVGACLLSWGAAIATVTPTPESKSCATEGEKKLDSHGWIEALDLSDKQRNKIEAMRHERRQATQDLRDKRRHLHEELKSIMAGDGQDEKARTIHNQLQDVQRRLADGGFESMLAIRSLLTPEQRKRFVELMRVRAVLKLDVNQ